MYQCNQPDNDFFISKLEEVQYNAALAITGAIKCTSHSKRYKEQGLLEWAFGIKEKT